LVKAIEIDKKIKMIDLNGLNHTSYFIQGEEKNIIIESGFPSETDLLIEGLNQLDLTPNDVDLFLATHIHLDHVGAAGFLASKNPNLIVLIHEIGAKHLINPDRLNASAKRAYGDRFDLIGNLKPIPSNQVHALKDTEIINLGGIDLKIFFTPGHAKHHLIVFEEKKRILFPGDALGTNYPGIPPFIVTPPPDYNMDLSINSIELIQNLKPTLLLYTHFGPFQPNNQKHYGHLKNMHIEWCGTIKRILKENPNTSRQKIIRAILKKTDLLNSITSKKRKIWEEIILNSLNLSIEGIIRYLRKC